MKLLKLISIFLIFHFVRRFIKMYRTMKNIQDQQAKGQTYQSYHKSHSQTASEKKTINVDFKVLD